MILKQNKAVLIVLFILFLIGSSIIIYKYLNEEDGELKFLEIIINGDNEIDLEYGDEYTDLGATAKFKDIDLTADIEVDNDLDTSKVGSYEYTYKVKYNNLVRKVSRTINVLDKTKPTIKLEGRKDLSLVVGNAYIELGATANDEVDGDLSTKIKIDASKLDIDTIGEYKITYKVQDSSNNEEVVERTIKVVDKPSANQKIPVLNYHFFYKDETNICHESICLQIDKFRQQLDYLRDNGFYTLTIDEFVRWMYGETELPEKSVLITVDDGAFGTAKDRGNYLIPTLEKYNMYATLFLITDWWPIEYYESDHLEIQSHTHDLHYEQKNCGHRSKVNCVSYDDLVTDLKKSIDVVKDTSSFCFPFYEATETSIKAVQDVGFKIAFVGGGRKASQTDDKYRIPRYPIHDSTSLTSFKNYVN